MQAVGRKRWSNTELERAVRDIARELGHFPSSTELRAMGRGDVAGQIAKNGGFLHWSRVTGIPRILSDSDTGWAGEKAAATRMEALGFTVTFGNGVKCPFDFLVDAILRVDVKAANYREYGHSKGWFLPYREAAASRLDSTLAARHGRLLFAALVCVSIHEHHNLKERWKIRCFSQ